MVNEIKEKIRVYQRSTTIAIAGNHINSVRFSKREEHGFRVIKDNMISVSGAVGDYDETVMWQKALIGLDRCIPYDVSPTEVHQEVIDTCPELLENKAFLQAISHLLIRLSEAFPQFLFSNQISMNEQQYDWNNNIGCELSARDGYYQVALIIKEKRSGNIIDALYAVNNRQYDEDAIIYDMHQLLDHYQTVVELEDGVYPIIASFTDLGIKLLQDLRGDLFATGASILSGKMGEKLFHESFSLYTDKNPETTFGIPFFDMEGTINDNYRYKLIEKGKFITPYLSKKEAKRFNLPATGSAGCEYDAVPSIDEDAFYLEVSKQTISDMTNREKAVYIAMASGGDTTSSGEFATPVQLAFLVEEGKIIGRLPEINVAGNIFEMFGKDYVGVPKDSLFQYAHKTDQKVVVKMRISR